MSTATLKLNSVMPSFALKGIDGKVYNSENFHNKALIVIFSCNHCPYVQAYENRIIEIQNDYKDKGLQIVAINSNEDEGYPEDSYEEMIKRAKEKNFNFLYLRDESQEIVKAFDASHTPEIFLFDDKKRLIFHGKIDDNWQEPNKAKSRYLREALDEYLAGKSISVPETFTIGCTIKFRK